MNLIVRLKTTTALNKAIRTLRNAPATQRDLIYGLVQIATAYRTLDVKAKEALWTNPTTPLFLYGPSLSKHAVDQASLSTVEVNPVDLDERSLKDPLEWLAGTTRGAMLEYLNDPALVQLAGIRETVWLTLFKGEYTKMKPIQLNATLSAVQAVLKLLREVL